MGNAGRLPAATRQVYGGPDLVHGLMSPSLTLSPDYHSFRTQITDLPTHFWLHKPPCLVAPSWGLIVWILTELAPMRRCSPSFGSCPDLVSAVSFWFHYPPPPLPLPLPTAGSDTPKPAARFGMDGHGRCAPHDESLLGGPRCVCQIHPSVWGGGRDEPGPTGP